MKKILAFALLLVSVSLFSQGRITIPQAINIISKQSMLSQRMAKDKIYYDNTSSNGERPKRLISSVVQFENNLNTLRGMKFSDKIERNLTHIELLWIGYEKSIMAKAYEDSSDEIMKFNDVILSVTSEVFDGLLTIAKQKKSYPYNTNVANFSKAYIATNKLKHTAQRLALYYTSYFYKISKYNNAVFEEIVSDIENQIFDINEVKNLNTDYIPRTEKINVEWNKIKESLKDVRAKKFISVHTSPNPETIYEGSNRLLKLSDLLGRTYKAVNDINK